MLQRLIRRFMRPRHYWRDLSFDELSELYTSMMFRSLAISLVGVFIPLYLYNLDYDVSEIFYFYTFTFCIWTLAVYPAALLVAKVGPKHTMLLSFVFQSMSMLTFVSLGDLRWPLEAVGMLLAVSNCLFFTAFHTDFSKVKHKDHGGKEVGWMFVMEKTGFVLGPAVGGLIAYFIGAQYIFMAAVILLFVGIIPLFMTMEPTALNQKLKLKDLKVWEIRHDLISHASLNVDNLIHLIIWPMFISIYIFQDNAYIQLGAIVSLSVFIAMLAARTIGKTIDNHKGRQLLRAGVLLNSAVHLFRPFVAGFPSALGINLVKEVLTPTYRMPYVKGMYDAADDLPGRRIVYIAAMEVVGNVGKSILFATLYFVSLVVGDNPVLFKAAFIAGAIITLGVMTERFKALDVK